jgi:hypothetical protein
MWCYIRRLLSWLLLLGALTFLILGLAGKPADAAIRQLEEAPGQVVYQARQTLTDQQGHSWQAIGFKRIRPDGNTSFYLRLVGFPGTVTIDRSQPLILSNSLGQTLTAADASSQIFTEAGSPEPHVGQYDLQPILSQLRPEIPLRLTLATTNHTAVILQAPPTLVQEWQALAGYES